MLQNAKIIANEFDFSVSGVNYKVESYVGKVGNCPAHERALMEEEAARAREQEKLRLKEESAKNMKMYLKEKNEKHKLVGETKEKERNDKIAKKKLLEDYNEQLRITAIGKKAKKNEEDGLASATVNATATGIRNPSPFNNNTKTKNELGAKTVTSAKVLKHNPNTTQQITTKKDKKSLEESVRLQESSQKDNFSFKDLQEDREKLTPQPQPASSYIKSLSSNLPKDSSEPVQVSSKKYIIDPSMISEEKEQKPPMQSTDLRYNFIKQAAKKDHYEEEENEPQKLFEENLESLKNFRKNGFFTQGSGNQGPKSQQAEVNSAYELEKEKTLKLEEEKRFRNELEKRRYIKALKNMMIEKFKEKNIVIPNICSCGQLQKKFDKLLEVKNVSISSVMNIECANNCIYYNKTNDYHKALTDIIKSIKNINYEHFG